MRYAFQIIACILFIAGCQEALQTHSMKLNYPETRKSDQVDTLHGVAVPDPYRWLEDDRSDETAGWVEAENAVTFDYLNNIPFRDAIKNRLESLLDYERVSAPFKEGNYEYYYKNDGLQNHSVLYRIPKDNPEADPEVYLDPNTFSEDATIGLSGVYFTKDGSLSAHLITEGGSDWRKAVIMNTATKEVVEDSLINIKFSGISWRGNEGFYYSSYDVPKDGSQLSGKTQYHKMYFHKLGTPQSQDVLVFGGEKQPNRYIFGYVTEDQNYLLIGAAQATSGNVLFVRDLRDPNSGLITVDDNYETDVNYLENVGDRFLLATNDGAPNTRVIAVNIKNPGKENWVDVIPETEHVLTPGAGGGKIFAEYLVDAKSVIKQYDLDGKIDWEIELPGIGSAGGFGAKFDDKELYYSFTSFTTPTSIYKYDITTGKSLLYRAPQVDFDPDAYETKQVFYKSKDGTQVPMFIVYKKGLKLDGSAPTYLYAYGGFNVNLTPGFSSFRVAWLEQGCIYAQPNLRGGGEYGEEWHKAGTKLQKQNVFDDFIAAGEYLIKEGYTSSDKLTIAGGSNGGLLVGATMTQRPDLARVALPAVGVLDMLRYHKFTAGAGWATDYGTADDSPEMFEYLRNYSPVHALKEGTAYPATLITTADHDDRVVPAHSFKFAARLQECHDGDNPVLIRIQTKAGHGNVSMEQQIAEAADKYAFVWANVGFVPEFAEAVLD